MAFSLDPVEYGKSLAELKRLTEDVVEGKRTIQDLKDRIEVLEASISKNAMEHLEFVKYSKLTHIEESLKKLENSIVVMTPKQAKDSGSSWVSMLLRNPTYLLWIVLGSVVISMVFMGYSFVEISQVIDKLK